VRALKVDDPETIGLRIEPGDLVQTKASTFVEIQLVRRVPCSSSPRTAPSSSRGSETRAESVSLGLIYGRVRAKVAKLSGAESFSIRSGGTVAGCAVRISGSTPSHAPRTARAAPSSNQTSSSTASRRGRGCARLGSREGSRGAGRRRQGERARSRQSLLGDSDRGAEAARRGYQVVLDHP